MSKLQDAVDRITAIDKPDWRVPTSERLLLDIRNEMIKMNTTLTAILNMKQE